MRDGTCVQEMAANRVRHPIMEACIPTAGNQWAAREFFGQPAALDQASYFLNVTLASNELLASAP